MSLESTVNNYLKDVLGIKSILLTQPVKESSSLQKAALVFIAPGELTPKEEHLLKKMALASPLQPVEILKVDEHLGRNEIEKRLNAFQAETALIFGEKLFHVIKGKESNFFAFINQSFSFAGVCVYASHELNDMCRGPNVNLLKKQVWAQMKQISKT
ncbi:MAG: hypothetical protein KDD58_12425 [Bdellovibrionales bacterium]|nr:hypothetical protein [Bdellovibrionales bacterium]